MFDKIVPAFVVSILLLSLVMGCSYPIPQKSAEKIPAKCPVNVHPEDENTNISNANTSKFPVKVYTEDESTIVGNVNITVCIDNVTVIVWDHQKSQHMVTPNLGPSKEITLEQGTHTLCAFEKNQNIINSTVFNITQEKYLAVIFWHSDNPNHPSSSILDFEVSDSPIGFD